MKKKSPPYAIIGAVILGIVAIVFFYKWEKVQEQKQADAVAAATAAKDKELQEALNSKVNITPTPTNMRNVLYATQPIEPGILISAAFYEKKETPTDILPDAFSDKDDVIGLYAIRPIEKGDPLTPRNLGKTLPYLSQRLPPGMRAISLPIFNAEVNDTGGFVVDGDKVDLLLTRLGADGTTPVNTMLVMQNVNVLYVPGPQIKTETTAGITPVAPPGDAIAVTFEVTPEQAQALVYLTHLKSVQFSMILKARKDKSEINIKPFASENYQDPDSYRKIQARVVDPSMARVEELAKQIEAAEKTQGNTNETPTPTPPSP